MVIKHPILVFLLTDPNIQKIDFSLLKYKITPKEYRHDLFDAIQREDIILRDKGPAGPQAGASYDFGYDSFELKNSFSISRWRDQAYFIHECTHAVIDMQNIGQHSEHETEAVAFVAEALFLESSNKRSLGNQEIRKLAHRIAKDLLKKNKKKVLEADARKLVKEIAKHPIYKDKTTINSNRFNRDWIRSLLRHL